MADETPAPAGEGLAVKATRGALWSGMSYVTLQIFNLAVAVILQRILAVDAYGLVATVAIFNGVIYMIADLGISNAVIQRKTLPEGYLDTAMWLNMGMGALVYMIVAFVVGPLIALVYGQPILRWLLMAAALPLIIAPVGGIHRLLLQRDGRFARLAVFETSLTIVVGVATILMALNGFGVWSLILGPVLNNALGVLLVWRLTPWRPRLRFNQDARKDLFKFGRGMMGFNIVNHFGANIDFVLIGKLRGEHQQGLYYFAFNWGTLTYAKIIPFIGRVLFPTFSQIQDDNARLRRGYSQVLLYASLLSFPIGAGTMAIAPEFISVIFPKYAGMVTTLRLLCLAGMTYSIVTFTGSIIQSKGRTDILFKVSWIRLIGFGGAVLIGLRYGLIGVAIADVAYGLSSIWIFQGIVGRLIEMSYGEYVRIFVPSACVALVVGLGSALWRWSAISAFGLGAAWTLASTVAVGALLYVLACAVFVRPAVRALWLTMRSVLLPYLALARRRLGRAGEVS